MNSKSLLFSLVLATALSAGADLIEFENETVGATPDGWVFSSDSSNVQIATTATSGDYVGGQAMRTDEGGSSVAGFSLTGPTITSIQADFLWNFPTLNTPTLAIYAWDDDENNGFQSAERTIGFGLDNDGQFELTSESGEIAGTTDFVADTWYRLTMTWSEPDGLGNRIVSLSALDLTNSSDLGVVTSATMSTAEFGVAPSEWDGIAFRMTRGTIDNIQTTTTGVPEPEPESGTSYSYLDATPANTTLNSDPVNSPTGVPLVAGSNYIDDGTSGSGSDNLWTYRTDASFSTFEGGAAFETDSSTSAGDAETTADLITTINLPTAGTYEIVAVFSSSSDRDIAARTGTNPGTEDIFTAANTVSADQSADPANIDFNNSFTNSRGGSSGVATLGTVTTTTDNESVSIFINGFASTTDTDSERTQYEGIGYRLAPAVEPPSEPKHRDIFLLAGQSNADGRGLISELTGDLASYAGPQNDIIINYSNLGYLNPDRSLIRTWVTLNPGFSRAPRFDGPLLSETFGMEIGAGKILSEHYANPAFIKVTEGGTSLGISGVDWSPAPLTDDNVGPLYVEFIEATRAALAELEAAGDTYTVHGMFWHQGEGDGNRTSRYAGLLTTLIESVRRDLEMPNLRFIIGELSPTKPQDFLDVQWQVSRDVPNTEFIFSRGLTTTDGTHFDTTSMITYGQRLGQALVPNRSILTFEQPTHLIETLDRQDEWSAASALEIATTTTQGEYSGGQAAGHVGASGTFTANRRNMIPLADARTMQADFFAGDTGSTLLIAGWRSDTNGDGQFSENETAIGLGLDSAGTFRVQVGSQSNLTSSFNYQTDQWYRLTLTWSEPDASGQRSVNLFARDLSNGADLNEGNSLMTLTTSAAEFAGAPVNWAGIGVSASRGLIDNIQVSPPGFTAWASLFHPTLQGSPTDDDDQDGIANAIEFAFGLDPLSFNSSSDLPQLVFGPNSATVSFTPQAAQPGTLYQIESSSDLTTWTLVPGTQSGSLLNFTIPTTDDSMFFRYNITVTE